MCLVHTLDSIHSLRLMEKELSYYAADNLDCGLRIGPSEVAVGECKRGIVTFGDVFLQVIDQA